MLELEAKLPSRRDTSWRFDHGRRGSKVVCGLVLGNSLSGKSQAIRLEVVRSKEGLVTAFAAFVADWIGSFRQQLFHPGYFRFCLPTRGRLAEALQ